MIQEAYVSFETAKLLKDKGFDESCRYYYVNNGNLMFTEEYFHNSEIKYGTYTGCICTAPTLQMAMKWLREVHKLHIIAEPFLGEGNEPNLSFNRWFWTILKEEGEYKPIRKIDEFPTYEAACENAIKISLENLI